MFRSVNAPTPRLARRLAAANTDRNERKHTGNSGRAAYSVRRANRADRQAARESLRSLTR